MRFFLLKAQTLANNWQGMESRTRQFSFWLGMTKMPETADRFFQAPSQGGFLAEPVAIWKARKFIGERSDEALPLTRVARFVKINPNYFSEKFKEVTGLNFVKYLARTRVAKSTELLRNSNLRISEIAFAAGFQSLSQFNRVFKRLAGCSPTEFRRSQRNESVGPQPENQRLGKPSHLGLSLKKGAHHSAMAVAPDFST